MIDRAVSAFALQTARRVGRGFEKRKPQRKFGPSVVLLRGEPLVPEVRGSALLQALHDCESELAQGAIVSLDWSGQPRAGVLPLR